MHVVFHILDISDISRNENDCLLCLNYLRHQSFIRYVYKTVEVCEALDNVVQQVFLEHVAPALDTV